MTTSFFGATLCAKHYSTCFIHMNPFSPYSSPVRQVLASLCVSEQVFLQGCMPRSGDVGLEAKCI